MKVLYGEELVEIDSLPDGKYLPKSLRFLFPTAPIVKRDNLAERIKELGYKNDKVEVSGPFNFLNLALKERE